MRENRTSGSMRGEGDDLRVALSLLLYRAQSMFLPLSPGLRPRLLHAVPFGG
jgi:hypothetical protein